MRNFEEKNARILQLSRRIQQIRSEMEITADCVATMGVVVLSVMLTVSRLFKFVFFVFNADLLIRVESFSAIRYVKT